MPFLFFSSIFSKFTLPSAALALPHITHRTIDFLPAPRAILFLQKVMNGIGDSGCYAVEIV